MSKNPLQRLLKESKQVRPLHARDIRHQSVARKKNKEERNMSKTKPCRSHRQGKEERSVKK